MANEIKLTFAGDTAQLENSFSRVGGAAKDMDRDVRAAGEGFDRFAERSDDVDTKAMGFRDTLTGLQDGFAGIKQVTSGDIGFESLLLLGFGIGDLASGFTNLLVPAMKSAVTWLGNTKVGQLAAAAATKVWTAAQWLMNTALLSSPITWIIVGIVALVAAVVLIATKTTWFQTIWKVAWGGIKTAALAVANWFKGPFANFFVSGFNTVKSWINRVGGWFRGMGSAIRNAVSNVVSIITSPFRSAFNMVARAWNNTVGQLSWSIPSWVPIVGGNSISAPRLPTFHTGGTASGAMGGEFLAVLRAGETVNASGGNRGGTVIEIRSAGSNLDDLLVEVLSRSIRAKGGNVQVVLGTNR